MMGEGLGGIIVLCRDAHPCYDGCRRNRQVNDGGGAGRYCCIEYLRTGRLLAYSTYNEATHQRPAGIKQAICMYLLPELLRLQYVITTAFLQHYYNYENVLYNKTLS